MRIFILRFNKILRVCTQCPQILIFIFYADGCQKTAEFYTGFNFLA
jgi:hypothetical protein